MSKITCKGTCSGGGACTSDVVVVVDDVMTFVDDDAAAVDVVNLFSFATLDVGFPIWYRKDKTFLLLLTVSQQRC